MPPDVNEAVIVVSSPVEKFFNVPVSEIPSIFVVLLILFVPAQSL